VYTYENFIFINISKKFIVINISEILMASQTKLKMYCSLFRKLLISRLRTERINETIDFITMCYFSGGWGNVKSSL